jgi:hypothetical protein
MERLLAGLSLMVILLAPGVAGAGQQCSAKPPAPDAVRKGLELAQKTREQLDQAGAEVALLGRVGSDLSEHGLRYSHMGVVQRDHPGGRWLVTHLLNHCGMADSALFVEGLGNFYLDDPFAYETVIVVPSPAVQQKLLEALASNLPMTVYGSSYSMIAYPFSTRYQNSNQWLLELIAASLVSKEGAVGRADAQRWLKEMGYTPSSIGIPPLKRAGARLFSANVRFDDHSAEEWRNGRYQVVTVESIIGFLAAMGVVEQQQVVRLD